LLQPVLEGTPALQPVWRPGGQGRPDERVAEGFAVDVELTATVGGQEVRWTERRWLVRAQAYAQAQEAALERRLDNARQAWPELVVPQQGTKQLFHAALLQAAEAIVQGEGVEGLLSYSVPARLTTRPVRAYKDRPAWQETAVSFAIDVRRDEVLIRDQKRAMGWQVDGSNALTLTLPQRVWAYRGQ
jgi:hypothetical protein